MHPYQPCDDGSRGPGASGEDPAWGAALVERERTIAFASTHTYKYGGCAAAGEEGRPDPTHLGFGPRAGSGRDLEGAPSAGPLSRGWPHRPTDPSHGRRLVGPNGSAVARVQSQQIPPGRRWRAVFDQAGRVPPSAPGQTDRPSADGPHRLLSAATSESFRLPARRGSGGAAMDMDVDHAGSGAPSWPHGRHG